MGISCGEKKSEAACIFNFTEKNPFAIIKGSAGSGKSMMMRHLFLNTIEKEERVSIFVELRRINEFEGNLKDFIGNILNENKFALNEDYIDKALKAGHFAIFLDGFDEIALSKRQSLIKETKKFARDFDKNIVIISSRPDDDFSSWSQFDIWQISPLNQNQALRLVRKVPSANIDEETRDKFIKDLEKTLFYKHESFLSNPLLLSIMAITYANSGDVPQKISTFYENAYIALFERHDALKGAFKRDRSCPLDIVEFKRIFSAFSTLTGSKLLEGDIFNSSLRFPKTDALNFINIAKNISIVTTAFESDDFLQDCIKAVCLLLEDGLEITFAHRSFQEYFSALFIADIDDIEVQEKLIQSAFLDRGNKIIDLLFEVNPAIVEKLLIVPILTELKEAINHKGGKTTIPEYKKFLSACFVRIDIQQQGMLSLFVDEKRQRIFERYHFLINRYLNVSDLRNLSRDGVERLIMFARDSPEKFLRKNNFLYKGKISTGNSEVINILAYDSEWPFSLKSLDASLGLRDELIQKHRQISSTMKDILLKNRIKY
jgi:hypothetical protein